MTFVSATLSIIMDHQIKTMVIVFGLVKHQLCIRILKSWEKIK